MDYKSFLMVWTILEHEKWGRSRNKSFCQRHLHPLKIFPNIKNLLLFLNKINMCKLHWVLVYYEQVKLWCTINEPQILSMGYASPAMAPGVNDIFNGIGNAMAWRNLLLAHAAVYKVYTNSFKAYQRGKAFGLEHVVNFEWKLTHRLW